MAAGVVDAVAQGLGGLEHDIALQVTPPDFELGDVRCPVRLWYGSLDRSAPPAFGRWLAARLADATLDIVDGAGHCFVLPRWEQIVRATAAAPPRRWPSTGRGG
jgi:pimeloyl-ACP methyl ester carboxylesterase